MWRWSKSRARIRREASDWIVRLADDADPADRRAFRQWHDSDPRHAEAYRRLSAIWTGASGLSRPADAEAEQIQPRGSLRLAFAVGLGAIAVAAAILLLGAAPHGPGQTALFATSLGEVRDLKLPDGSSLSLHENSRVEASFNGPERRLTLRQGRVRLHIRKDGRPFVLAVAGHEISTWEASVDVSQEPASVVMLEGAAEVRRAGVVASMFGSPVRLGAGEKLLLDDATGKVETAAKSDLSWPMLEFDNSRLDQAVAAVNRHSNAQLRLESDRIKDLRVSGAFRAGDAVGFAESVAAAFGLHVEPGSDGSLALTDPPPRHP